MKKLMVVFVVLIVATGGWFAAWKSMMADDVAFVEAALKQQRDAIKAATPSATLKADAVYATGFPFRFRVAVHRPTLTQIWNGESYAMSFEKIELQRVNDARWRVLAPAEFDSMYAKEGSAPEQYRIGVNEVPGLWLEGDRHFTHYGAILPKKLVLDVTLNGTAKQIGFDFPLQLPVPVFQQIPAQMSHPLQIFVGMLREAMIYQK